MSHPDPDPEPSSPASLEDQVGVPGREDGEGAFTPLTLQDPQGRSLGFAFTHADRLTEFIGATDLETENLVVRPATRRTLFTQLVQAGLPLVLDPDSAGVEELTVAEMAALVAGRAMPSADPADATRPADRAMQITAPDDVPDGLTDRLAAYLGGLGPVGTPRGVESATLGWVRYGDGQEGFVLGVRTALGDRRITAGIDEAIGHLGGRFVDVVLAGPGEPLGTDALPAFLPTS